MIRYFLMMVAGIATAAMALGDEHRLNLLVYSHTDGFRHGEAIEAGIEVLQEMAQEEGWGLTLTEDPTAFTAENLGQYDVVVFNNTTRDVLPEAAQRSAFKSFIRGGGGFVGIHAASDTLYDWEWYGQLIGAYFRGHPRGMQTARIQVEDPQHPSMQGIGHEFEFHDEWYWFRSNPRERVHVLATLDRASHPELVTYDPENKDADHPIIWCHEFDGGRAWYTALGHHRGPVTDDRFVRMLRGGILWAADK